MYVRTKVDVVIHIKTQVFETVDIDLPQSSYGYEPNVKTKAMQGAIKNIMNWNLGEDCLRDYDATYEVGKVEIFEKSQQEINGFKYPLKTAGSDTRQVEYKIGASAGSSVAAEPISLLEFSLGSGAIGPTSVSTNETPTNVTGAYMPSNNIEYLNPTTMKSILAGITGPYISHCGHYSFTPPAGPKDFCLVCDKIQQESNYIAGSCPTATSECGHYFWTTKLPPTGPCIDCNEIYWKDKK
jgi:hypothetical protein